MAPIYIVKMDTIVVAYKHGALFIAKDATFILK